MTSYEEHQDRIAAENCLRGLHTEDIREEVDSFGHPVRLIHVCSECGETLEVLPGEFA